MSIWGNIINFHPIINFIRHQLLLVIFSEAPPWSDGARMRVGDQIVRWEEGKMIVFDDSFEHEVWNESGGTRIVLIIDFNHPDLGEEDWRMLDQGVKVMGHEVDGPVYSLDFDLTEYRQRLTLSEEMEIEAENLDQRLKSDISVNKNKLEL